MDPNTQGSVVITPDSLAKSFQTYRQDLITMPVYGLSKLTPFVQIRLGVRYKETVGELTGDMQLAPYDPKTKDANDVNINGRTLETFLGNAVKNFDPNSVIQSIYGSETVQGEDLKNVPITKKVWIYLMGRLGQHLYDSSFRAKRVEGGKTTDTLFNGFSTIADTEIADGKMSAAIGNYHELAADITINNAEDSVNEIFDAMDEKLKDEDTIMLMRPNYKMAYNRDYQNTHGSLPYNKEFNKTFVEGSDNKCEMVGLSCIPAGTIITTTRNNLLIGLATTGDKVNFSCEKALDSYYQLAFVASMFFGCQYESINKERLLYTKVKTA